MRVTRLARLATALGLAACVGSYSNAIEETRAGLVGLPAKELRRCLGAPTDVAMLSDGVEQQTYRFQHEDDAPTFSSGSGNVIVSGRPLPGMGSVATSGRGTTVATDCELDFELRNGAVADVRARGRDSRGMNADGACLLQARRCLPDEEEVQE